MQAYFEDIAGSVPDTTIKPVVIFVLVESIAFSWLKRKKKATPVKHIKQNAIKRGMPVLLLNPCNVICRGGGETLFAPKELNLKSLRTCRRLKC